MGTVLQAQGKYKEAATHYERSLAIYIKVHGTKEHPKVHFQQHGNVARGAG
jgi:hypothetical protein